MNLAEQRISELRDETKSGRDRKGASHLQKVRKLTIPWLKLQLIEGKSISRY
jgi:hypothetical protein